MSGSRKRGASALWKLGKEQITKGKALCSSCLVFSGGKKQQLVAWQPYQALTIKQPENERLSFRIKSEDAEMWADYVAFKAAGLMDLWLQKWSGNLSITPQLNATI